MRFTILGAIGLAAALVVSLVGVASAEETPAQRISAFYAEILDTMKVGKAIGFSGRYKKLLPAIEETLDLPTMTHYAIGPKWTGLSESEQTALKAAFTRMTVSNYAHNFDSYSGEKFTVEPNVQERGPDRIVDSHIIPASGSPVSLSYRMRQSGANWKVIDIYYEGAISELTTRRADFMKTLSEQGVQALIAHLNALADDLAK